ncbi:MAG TPA: helix-turn-helix domain-containing protein [Gemmataceae bacterium]|nr:helix-turn-helix domain-containing protein [Gemmataceae bacterium]
MPMPTEQLKTEDAAAYLNVSVRTLHRLRAAHRLQPTRFSKRCIRWSKAQLDRFIQRNTK